jgi:hypothetical protein
LIIDAAAFFSSSANRIARARSLFTMTIQRHAAHGRFAFTLTDHKPGSVYFRPPSNYLEPATTLLAVLRKLLVRPMAEVAPQ